MRFSGALLAVAAVAGSVLIPAIVSEAPASAAPSANAVVQELNSLKVKGRAPKTGYDRNKFGEAWADNVSVTYGRNGCDTRNDILRRDLRSVKIKPGTNGCVVASGTLTDPYTRSVIQFVRGPRSAEVQIDHLVALSDAWQKGAQQWSASKRRDFANDPRNLLAVSGGANSQKRDGDAATWLPANKSYRCTYVTKQVRVKKVYGLWVTAAERDAIRRVLSSCGANVPQTPAPDNSSNQNTNPPRTTTPPRTTPRPVTPPPASDVYYQNCKAAKAAGAAPLYRGQPGYRSALDGDDDGVACES